MLQRQHQCKSLIHLSDKFFPFHWTSVSRNHFHGKKKISALLRVVTVVTSWSLIAYHNVLWRSILFQDLYTILVHVFNTISQLVFCWILPSSFSYKFLIVFYSHHLHCLFDIILPFHLCLLFSSQTPIDTWSLSRIINCTKTTLW